MFLDVGKALAEIHAAMLYRETHKEFKRYCKDVWDLGQSTAYQKMDGYRAVKLLENKSSAIAELLSDQKEDENLCDTINMTPDPIEPCEVILPINEAQARKLTNLSPDEQVKAWSIVLKQLNEGKKLTTSLGGKAAKEIKEETTKRTRRDTKKLMESTELVSKLFKNQ